jgi:Domain of unknown function (DUF6429)
MSLTLHDSSRAWKGFDWETLDRLYEKGWIENPRSKAKSVVVSAMQKAGNIPPKGDAHDIHVAPLNADHLFF